MNINEIKPYEKNPRRNDEAVDKVAASIKEFGFQSPIVVDKNNVIIAGHTRYRAAKKLGLEDVPVVVAKNLTDEQVRAYRLADNKTAEFSEWDYGLLDEELGAILELDMEQFGFSLEESKGDDVDGFGATDPVYTTKTKIPQYEITGERPELSELVDLDKTNQLIEEIEESNVTEEEKAFLIEAAKRHSVFNYRNIAEYYAHADKEMQELMEKSALVIIDIDDAIANGFTNLSDSILQMVNE